MLGFPNNFLLVVSPLERERERERERESQIFLPSISHTLECQDHSSSHLMEDLGCMRPPKFSNMFFIRWILIQEHQITSISFKSLTFYFKMVLKSLFLLPWIQRSLGINACTLQDPGHGNKVIQVSNRMLNQLQNQILRKLVLLQLLMVPALSLYTMMTRFMRVGLTLCSLLCKSHFGNYVRLPNDIEQGLQIGLID